MSKEEWAVKKEKVFLLVEGIHTDKELTDFIVKE